MKWDGLDWFLFFASAVLIGTLVVLAVLALARGGLF